MRSIIFVATFCSFHTFFPSPAISQETVIAPLSLLVQEDHVAVRVGDQPFATYWQQSGSKPIVWPIIGPTGKEMTRAFPMEDRPGQTVDHVHHRSFWFTQLGINGVDFWAEPKPGQPLKSPYGQVVHQQYGALDVEDDHATIATLNDWVDADGKKIAEDSRRLTFWVKEDARYIDLALELRASETDLEFTDTKEGTFGVRIPDSMRVDAKLGGTIVNDQGKKNADAWGKPAPWVDYYGPVAGETLGIAILCHPTSFRPTPRWHVRNYGLFAANHFGEKDFPPLSDYQQPPVSLKKGETLLFQYRVIFHVGDTSKSQIAERFQEYASSTPATPL